MPDNQPSNASLSKSRVDQDDSPQPIDSQLTTDDRQPLTAPHAHAASLTLPLSLGRYELQEEIARGGMGAILRAEDTTFRRPLAIKVLLPDFEESDNVKQRFLDEAQLMGRLQHPGIPPVHDRGALPDGRPFFCMKLIKGRTLAELLKQRDDANDNLPQLIDIFEQICQTMAYAHSQGILHRDLKPHNVMVGAFGEVQVMDWGLAKRLGTDESAATAITTDCAPHETAAGSILGTPAYMAPEQARGEIAQLNERSDVFGLGAILCEILTGKPAYVGTGKQRILQRAMDGDLVEAMKRMQDSNADRELIDLAKRCLSPTKEHRPRDAAAVAQDVRAHQERLQQRLRQAEIDRAQAETKAVEEKKRRRVWLGLVTAVLLFVVGAAGFVLWYQQDRAQLEIQRKVDESREETRVKTVKEEKEKQRLEDLRKETDNSFAVVQELRLGLRYEEAKHELEKALARFDKGGLPEREQHVRRCLDDCMLVRKLDQIRLNRVDALKGKGFDREEADRQYASAFAQMSAGAVTKENATLVAQHIAESAFKDDLVGFIEDWAALTPDAERRDWLLGLARMADPHPVKDPLRDPKLWNDLTEIKLAVELVDVTQLSPQMIFAFAVRILETGTDESVTLLQRARRHHEHDFWVNFLLACVLDSTKNHQEAVGYYLVALALRPKTALVHAALGQAYNAMGDPDKAIDHLTKAIDLDPKYTQAHVGLGNAYKAKGDPDKAIEFLIKAIDVDPKDAQAHVGLGNAYKAKGDPDKAIEHYNKAIDLDSKDVNAHVGLGNAFFAKGNSDKAIEQFTRAVDLDPGFAQPHASLGVAYFANGNPDKAIKHFTKAIDLDPKNAIAHYNLGNFYKAKGDADKAIGHYTKAINLDPKNAMPHIALGNLYVAKGDVDNAIEHYTKALNLDPKNAMPHNNLGNAYKAKGDPDKAIEHYTKAINLDPKNAMPHNNLGNLYVAKGNVDKAIEHYTRAIELDPKDATAHNYLGNLYVAKADPDKAIAHYTKAIKLDAHYAQAHCNFGQLLRRQGKLKEALTHLKTGHELGTKRGGAWRYPSDRWVAECEKLIALDKKLSAIDDGKEKPKDAQEVLGLALLCQQAYKERYLQAVTFYQDAFRAESKLVNDLNRQYRYNAACAAALASAGLGKDAGDLKDEKRTELREQALKWLQADLAVYVKTAESNPRSHTAVQQRLVHWQSDPDLASVRDAKALEKLSDDERKQWRELWDAHKKLLSKVKQ